MAWHKLGALVALLALLLGMGVTTVTTAQDNQSALGDAEATIEALQTTVAEQATTIAELNSDPTPTPLAEVNIPQPPSDPVDLGSGIFLYSYLLAETDSGLRLAADLVNSSGSATLAPNLTATYYDADGNRLGDGSLSSYVHWADIDSHIPYWTLTVLSDAYERSEIDRVEFSITPDEFHDYAEVDSSSLAIVGVPMEGPDGAIAARVQNNGDTPVEEVTIVYALYDTQGIIIGSCFDFLDVVIHPGKSVNFSVSGHCVGTFGIEDQAIGGKPFNYRLLVSL